jgi:hypothetical protein
MPVSPLKQGAHMDLTVLKKKISTFRSEGGKLRNVSDDVLGEIIHAWENWSGSSKAFYSAIGVDHRKAASMLGKAKRLKRDGVFSQGDFTELKIDHQVESASISPCIGIEIVWDNKHVIRFQQVHHLINFLRSVDEEKKAA